MLNTNTLERESMPPVADEDDIDIFAKQRELAAKYKIAEDAPVLPPFTSRGKVELVVRDDGMSMVLFESELPDAVHWVEYDMDVDSLTFVTWRGAIFTLGMKIHKPFRKYLSRKHAIYLVQMDATTTPKMIDSVPMVVRRIGI